MNFDELYSQGYNDDDIVGVLRQKYSDSFDFNEARKAGADNKSIVEYFKSELGTQQSDKLKNEALAQSTQTSSPVLPETNTSKNQSVFNDISQTTQTISPQEKKEQNDIYTVPVGIINLDENKANEIKVFNDTADSIIKSIKENSAKRSDIQELVDASADINVTPSTFIKDKENQKKRARSND